ncbi:unnamed protein product [Microthlaspi erraticum]|uniref:Uncharacterized protein n=1 Tax=Microthlaspi erraticum TaxID=1685480 RepID=A0A6D2JJS5_9BRAS|nr:unnamed protein product [Microthlaspi erraticum]
MLSKAKKGSHNRTRDNMGFEMKRLSAPQRTGRLGRGLEMGDGHQEHSMQLGLPHGSLDRACGSSSSSSSS